MSKCIMCGNELTTGDFGKDMICTSCRNSGFEFPNTPQYIPYASGWLCPRCGTINSPSVENCSCYPPTITTTGISGTWFDNIPPENLRRVKQNMIEYLRQSFPEIYGDLKDET